MSIFAQLNQRQVCSADTTDEGLVIRGATGALSITLTRDDAGNLARELRAIVQDLHDPNTPVLDRLEDARVFVLNLHNRQLYVANPLNPNVRLPLEPDEIMAWADEIERIAQPVLETAGADTDGGARVGRSRMGAR